MKWFVFRHPLFLFFCGKGRRRSGGEYRGTFLFWERFDIVIIFLLFIFSLTKKNGGASV